MNPNNTKVKKEKSSLKKFQERVTFSLLLNLFYLLFRAFSLTYRYKVIGLENRDNAAKLHKKGALSLGSWHKNSWGSVSWHIGQPCAPLISQSKDGELVAFLSSRIGMTPIRGSSTRGGTLAIDALLTAMEEEGKYAAIMVDGPKGPPKRVKPGIVYVAKKQGTPMIPVTAIGKSNWVINSWDRTRIPKPFTTIVIMFGKGIPVPPDANNEVFTEFQNKMKVALDDQEEEVLRILRNES